MKQKKLAITLAAAIMLSSFSGISPFATVLNAAAEEATTGKTEETKELTVPQNVRVENGFLKWDEVEGAYGYNVSTTDRDGNEISVVYYEMSVELVFLQPDSVWAFYGFRGAQIQCACF